MKSTEATASRKETHHEFTRKINKIVMSIKQILRVPGTKTNSGGGRGGGESAWIEVESCVKGHYGSNSQNSGQEPRKTLGTYMGDTHDSRK